MYTHTHTGWLLQGSNPGRSGLQGSVYAQGHVAAPCRYTVITEDEADDRRGYEGDQEEGKTQQARRAFSPSAHTHSHLQAAHALSSALPCTLQGHTGEPVHFLIYACIAQHPGPRQAAGSRQQAG